MDQGAKMSTIAAVEVSLPAVVGLQERLMTEVDGPVGDDEKAQAQREKDAEALKLVDAHLVAARQFCKRLRATMPE